MKRIEETLTKAFDLGVQAANIGVKSALFCFLEMFLIYIILKRKLDTISVKFFDCLSHSFMMF